MPNHQARRTPLPADYQHPTHGVDCDCVTCWLRIVGDISNAYCEAFVKAFEAPRQPDEPTADTPWAV